MVAATPSPTPNPNALRFGLDVTLPETVSASSPEDAAGNPFLAAVLGIDGVASVFGTANFVTVTRATGGDWDEIVPAVQAAAAEHL
ncbi:MAG TPA: NifU N-terminal domain-containing protein [Acidimicrobiales bacterium]|nr:NifU N-terminal domain-containing protein [Acidimicrobiales bacterium]